MRCVRAYYYAQLMRMYGPVILLKDEQPDFSGTDMFRERNTWDDVCNGLQKSLRI